MPLDERTYAPVPRRKYILRPQTSAPPRHWIPPKQGNDPETCKFSRMREDKGIYRWLKCVSLGCIKHIHTYRLMSCSNWWFYCNVSAQRHTREMNNGLHYEQCCPQLEELTEDSLQIGGVNQLNPRQWLTFRRKGFLSYRAPCQGKSLCLPNYLGKISPQHEWLYTCS